ncbi:MAG TPA: HSP90 family protein [Trebonia sp.]|jgi:molecular chaperone HtpG|nr:HSP90 family protein [Trebonia sp.]
MSHEAYAFQVDLRGLVDLLSQHLYSSPRVFIRELLQNAVDATTARRLLNPQAPSAIRIEIDGDRLSVADSGIGLTEADAHQFLATIGNSSKRDDLAGARREFLGQFGIGLLACFTVADQIRVVTRSAREPDAKTIEWLAKSDGTYGVRILPDARHEPGTTVYLTARPGAEHWFEPGQVTALARDYGELLPYEVTVESWGRAVRISEQVAVWDRPFSSDPERQRALLEYATAKLGFAPLDVVELDVPIVGLKGAAFVLPQAANPVEPARHRVYLKGMLLSEAAAGLLPEWAFFVRCIVNADGLRPTASRESLYEDETQAAVRENLGRQLRDWLTRLAGEDPRRLAEFLDVHALGVKALARHDLTLLRIMLPHLRFESTEGQVTLTEYARRHPAMYLAPTVEEFRQVAPIAAAQGIGVLNGGYTYDTELIGLLPELVPGVTVSPLDADVISSALDAVSPQDELALGRLLAQARATLDPLDCDVILRAFHPVTVSALYLDSRSARNERTRAQIAADADDLWGEILGALKSTGPRAQLVLNYHSPVVRRLGRIGDSSLLTAAVESLYGQSLLMTHRPLRPADAALLNRAFGELLDRATRAESLQPGAAREGEDER